MYYKLSQFGFSKEETEMLQNRLSPQVNKHFFEGIAEKNKIKPEQIESLDYSDNELFKQQKMIEGRQLKAKALKGVDTSEFDYPFKTIEEAQASGQGQHIQLKEPITPEKLNESIKKTLKIIEEDDIVL